MTDGRSVKSRNIGTVRFSSITFLLHSSEIIIIRSSFLLNRCYTVESIGERLKAKIYRFLRDMLTTGKN